ncbi:chalcone isomerase family protein [Noviherbaspirillum agri]
MNATRRAVLMTLACAPLFALPAAARAGAGVLAGLQRWGSGKFRRFGFLVYEATLWAGNDPQRPPLALRLDYKRHIKGHVIADASVTETRRFVGDEAILQSWGEQMRRVFPDVKPGDHILGVYGTDGARFYQGERLIGAIASPGFAEAFFAIWLDPRTSAPELRAALLQREEP